MIRKGRILLTLALVVVIIAATACSGSGGAYRGSAAHGIPYGHYYGPRPWGYYPGYVDDGPIAVPLPEMGMPDMGTMDMGMGMDMGAFDF